MEIVAEQFLAIIWEDGHESIYEGPELRRNCPCAGCRTAKPPGPAAASESGPFKLLPPTLLLIGLEEVGNYAVRLVWSDGHSTGLYDLRLLRSLCPCTGCIPG
jgi:DUF971 family protein